MDIEPLLLENRSEWLPALTKFTETYSTLFAFPELDEGTKRSDLWKGLTRIIRQSTDFETIKQCFIAVRILGREKASLNILVCNELLEMIKTHAGLETERFSFSKETTLVSIEALKSICNLAYNSRDIAERCYKNGIFEGILKRIARYSDPEMDEEVKFFDLKVLFILSAILKESRQDLKPHLNIFIEYLSFMLDQAGENHIKNAELPPIYLNEFQVDKVSELFKVIFNGTIALDDSDPEIMASCLRLTDLLRNYLLVPTCDLEHTWNLRTHIIHLLTNIPSEAYKNLISPIQEKWTIPKNLHYDGYNMTALYEIVMFLSAKFNDEVKIGKQHELLSPVVTCLVKAASHRPMRKYLRSQILPPLKDVHNRPEQGKSLRNHLCRLLTTPITQLRDLVAELLFILCKRNVARMIKYTGYGNAAGLLAQRGLLAGGPDKSESEFSSESSDSETEEYADHKHGINPVIGCYEAPHASPMDNMTEEQKEYEAMKLVNLMDNLMRTGVIKPCKIGEDGKPQPVEHVLELQEKLKEQFHNENTDDDHID